MRPRRPNPGGGLIGAALGGLAAGWPGAVVAGLAAAAATGEIPSLEEALVQELSSRGLQLLRVVRESPFALTLLFRRPPHYGWTLAVVVQPTPALNTAVAVDDALYDQAVVNLNHWRELHPPHGT